MHLQHHQARASAAPKRKPSITNLYSDFAVAHAAFFNQQRELDAAAGAARLDGTWHSRFERITTTCNKIARRIATAPAASLQEIQLKLRVVAWMESDMTYQSLEDLDHWRARWKPSPDVEESLHILAQIQEDLLRVSAH